MNRVVLQVPMDYQLRKAAEEGAIEQGFVSLQDAVRLFLSQMAKRTVNFSLSTVVPLSAKNEERYLNMISEIKKNKVKTKNFEQWENEN